MTCSCHPDQTIMETYAHEMAKKDAEVAALKAQLSRQSAEIEKMREALEKIRLLTRHTFQFGSTKAEGIWLRFEEVQSALRHPISVTQEEEGK